MLALYIESMDCAFEYFVHVCVSYVVVWNMLILFIWHSNHSWNHVVGFVFFMFYFQRVRFDLSSVSYVHLVCFTVEHCELNAWHTHTHTTAACNANDMHSNSNIIKFNSLFLISVGIHWADALFLLWVFAVLLGVQLFIPFFRMLFSSSYSFCSLPHSISFNPLSRIV